MVVSVAPIVRDGTPSRERDSITIDRRPAAHFLAEIRHGHKQAIDQGLRVEGDVYADVFIWRNASP